MNPARWIVVFSMTAVLAGQQKDSGPQLVNLNLTAVDSSGGPVSDLRAEDLQISDNGKPRNVVWLHQLPRKGPLISRPDTIQTSGEFSNRSLTTGSATFILLDLFNSDLATRGQSANEISHALERLESSENVYLYLLDSKARIFGIHAVTAAKNQRADDIPWTRRIKPLLDQALRDTAGMKMQDDRYTSLRIGPTWQALSGMAALMTQVPGPKSFVWVTQGVENGVMDTSSRSAVETAYIRFDTAPLRDFAVNLNAVEATIYSVQQRSTSLLAPDNQGSAGDTLQQLSALTGGKRFPTGNTAEAISQAIGGAREVNYRMAFAPDRLDGKYHKLRVTTTRSDVKILTAQSYYAAAVPDLTQRDTAIVDVTAGSPYDYPEIGLTATVAKVEGAPGEFRLKFRVNAPDILFVKEGDRYKATVEVDLVEYGSNGRGTVAGGMPFNLDMSADEYAKANTGGIEMIRQVKIGDDIGRVRLVLMDHNSNLAGTVTMPVTRTP